MIKPIVYLFSFSNSSLGLVLKFLIFSQINNTIFNRKINYIRILSVKAFIKFIFLEPFFLYILVDNLSNFQI